MGTQTRRVDRALVLVDSGKTAYAAAKATGIALSTIYRALARRRRAEEKADPVGAALARLARLRQE
jgi:hypothetical protein